LGRTRDRYHILAFMLRKPRAATGTMTRCTLQCNYKRACGLSEHHLSDVKCLGYALGSIASDATQSGHRDEGLIDKPATSSLANKVV
jgi:hypothetical protein